MNKQQLVDAVGERLGDRRTAAAAVDAVLDTVSGTLAQGERVSLFGFGVFEKVDRAARTARNPSTGGTVQVPATSVPRFRPGQALKDAVSGGASRPARRATAVSDAPATEAGAAASGTGKAKGKPKGDGKAKGKGTSDSKGKGKAASDSKGKAKSDRKGKGK